MDKIQKAQIALLTGQGIFYAALIAQMNRIEGKEVLPEGALAAVQVLNGRINLLTDCTRIDKFTLDQCVRILEHECLHVILEHSSRAPVGSGLMWNIATDLAVNSLIPHMDLGVLPGKDQFVDFPGEKTAEFYYGLLKDKEETGKLRMKEGKMEIKGKDGKWSEVESPKCPSAHKGEHASSDAEKLAKEVVKQAIEEAHSESTRCGGGPPGGLESVLKELLGKNEINWKKILKQYIGNAVKAGSKHTWKRPSRRFGESQKGKMPERILSVGVAIDTSGSITDEDLGEFIAEMKGIMTSYKSTIHIVENSTQVDRTYDLKPSTKINSKFFGRGGGDHRPTFEYFEKTRKKLPDVLVYFTDGFEEFPKQTRIKTIWVRPSQVADYPQTFPFGRVIQIPKKKNHDH